MKVEMALQRGDWFLIFFGLYHGIDDSLFCDYLNRKIRQMEGGGRRERRDVIVSLYTTT